jgi:hypothetical protein
MLTIINDINSNYSYINSNNFEFNEINFNEK